MVCSACGADFQSSNTQKPGFLPQLGQLEELRRLQNKAEGDASDWSAEDEIEWLIQTAVQSNRPVDPAGGPSPTATQIGEAATSAISAVQEIDIPGMAESTGNDGNLRCDRYATSTSTRFWYRNTGDVAKNYR